MVQLFLRVWLPAPRQAALRGTHGPLGGGITPHQTQRQASVCQAFQSSVLYPLGLMQPQLVAPDQGGGWKPGRFAHPNALHCFLPCGDWVTQPLLSVSGQTPRKK